MKYKSLVSISALLMIVYFLSLLQSFTKQQLLLNGFDSEEYTRTIQYVETEKTWAISNQQKIHGTTYSQCDATEDYLFFSYTKDSCVDVYDKNGTFGFSIVLPDYPNGAVSIRCVDSQLYVQPKEGHVIYVFEGKSQIAQISRQEAKQLGYGYRWFRTREQQLKITREYISYINSAGETTLQIPTPDAISYNVSSFGENSNLAIFSMLLVFLVVSIFYLLGKSHIEAKQNNMRRLQ